MIADVLLAERLLDVAELLWCQIDLELAEALVRELVQAVAERRRRP